MPLVWAGLREPATSKDNMAAGFHGTSAMAEHTNTSAADVRTNALRLGFIVNLIASDRQPTGEPRLVERQSPSFWMAFGVAAASTAEPLLVVFDALKTRYAASCRFNSP